LTSEHYQANSQDFIEQTLRDDHWTDLERETLRHALNQISRCATGEIEAHVVRGERGAWILEAKPTRPECCPFSIRFYPDDEEADACNCLVQFTAGEEAYVNLPDAVKPWPCSADRIPEIIESAIEAVLEGMLYEKLHYAGDQLRRTDFELPTRCEQLGAKYFLAGFFLFACLRYGKSTRELHYEPYRLRA